MDLLTIVKLALFVPFFLVLAIFAIVYLIAGYKKDLGRSIISLSATIVATAVSLLLAKLISFALSGPIFSALSSAMGDSATQLGVFGEGFVKGIVEIVLSFVLFVLFFIITLAVLKSVGKKIKWGKLESLNKDSKGTRLAGMGIRAVDAILVSVMLLLPLYGTIAMVAPPAATLMRMSERTEDAQSVMQISDEHKQTAALSVQFVAVSVRPAADVPGVSGAEPDAAEILNVMSNHPVLVPYKYGPGAWVYSGLSTFSMNGKQVDVAAAAESLEGILDRVEIFIEAIESGNEEKIFAATEEIIDFARKKVVNQRWSYDMVMAFVGEIDNMVEEFADVLSSEEELMEMYDMMRPLLDMSFEEYTHNAEGLLEFAAWIMDIYAKFGNSDYEGTLEEAIELLEEIHVRIGNLLNHSEQAIGLKRIILQICAQSMFEDISGSVGASSRAASFIKKYYGDGKVAEEDRLAEAGAFFQLTNANDALDFAEVFARYPLFGADAVIETVGKDLYIYGIGYGVGEQLPSSDKAEEAYAALDNMLRNCENASFDKTLSFSSDAYFYLTDELGFSYSYGYGGATVVPDFSYSTDGNGDYYFSQFGDGDVQIEIEGGFASSTDGIGGKYYVDNGSGDVVYKEFNSVDGVYEMFIPEK